MESILNYQRSDEDNYYHILGCDETASVEQILAEYKALSLQYHPDKNPNDENSVNRFQKLVKAKEVLTDPDKRKMYDKWLRSGFCVPFEKYLNMNKCAHTSVHWVSKKKKDLMLEDACCYSEENQTITECSSSENMCRNVAWERDPACDLLKKFRNYEI